MRTILIGDEIRRTVPPLNSHDQHIHLPINNDYHHEDYDEVLNDYHYQEAN